MENVVGKKLYVGRWFSFILITSLSDGECCRKKTHVGLWFRYILITSLRDRMENVVEKNSMLASGLDIF